MNTITFAFPILYNVFIIGLCTFLLMRGITHAFVGLFAGAALLEIASHMGYFVLQQMPGGLGANVGYIPLLTIVGMVGALVSVAAFISLAMFLLRAPKPSA